MDILDRIVARTRELNAERMAAQPLDELQRQIAAEGRKTLSLVSRLAEERPHVIAEFKRKSPSKPVINLEADPLNIAAHYQRGGASAMSVLTEPDFFAGSPEDLRRIRATQPQLPLLRKDFLVDPYQLYEARAMGADVVLLIARCLSRESLAELCLLAHSLDLEVLCEIHNLEELDVVADAPIDLLGVNCRDLRKFETNLEMLVDLVPQLPNNVPLVAESGIRSPQDVARLYEVGYQLFLVGEYLMRSEDPAQRLAALVGQ